MSEQKLETSSSVPKQKWTCNGLTVEMSGLHVSPTNKRRGRRRVWKLDQVFTVRIYSTHNPQFMDQHFSIPIGFETDYATMPLLAQVFLGGRDDYLASSIIHDALCDSKVQGFVSNATMRIIMLAEGIPFWKRWCVFYALMLFGYESPVYRFVQMAKKVFGGK